MPTDGSHGNDSADAEKAETESLFREVNERIHAVNAQRVVLDLPAELICECAKADCTELVTLNAVEYRGLRTHSTWFVIAPADQHFPALERIVAKDGHYWIVEKHDGARPDRRATRPT
jgi:tyrosyl-tRNA synthetase